MSEVSGDLKEMYAGYYQDDDRLLKKRKFNAETSIQRMQELLGPKLGSVLDVGAGNGNVIAAMEAKSMAAEITALEISSSGIQAITDSKFPSLKEVKSFDGYSIPYPDDHFDLALASHVVEHVEHERSFLRELSRVAKKIYVEVPLEGGMRCKSNRTFGHINFYTAPNFINLTETSGLEIISSKVFAPSEDVEKLLYGQLKGTVKYNLRRLLLTALGSRYAPHAMTFYISVVAQKAK